MYSISLISTHTYIHTTYIQRIYKFMSTSQHIVKKNAFYLLYTQSHSEIYICLFVCTLIHLHFLVCSTRRIRNRKICWQQTIYVLQRHLNCCEFKINVRSAVTSTVSVCVCVFWYVMLICNSYRLATHSCLACGVQRKSKWVYKMSKRRERVPPRMSLCRAYGIRT